VNQQYSTNSESFKERDKDTSFNVPPHHILKYPREIIPQRSWGPTMSILECTDEMAADNSVGIGLQSNGGKSIAPFLSSVSERRRTAFHAIQEWEGYVVKFEDDSIVAHLVNLTEGDTYASEAAIIPIEEISEHDMNIAKIGSIFRWVIGYEETIEGTRKRVSSIVFRDLPKVTENDIREGDEWAKKIASVISDDISQTA